MSQVILNNNKIFINGEEIPACPHSKRGSNITTINNHIYVNGYEYRNGKWKMTLKSLFYKFF